MNLELTNRQVGLMWEALTEYIAICSDKKEEKKTQEIIAIRGKIEHLCGDNTG